MSNVHTTRYVYNIVQLLKRGKPNFFSNNKLCSFIQPEAGYSSVSELGETGAVQFRDVSALTLKLSNEKMNLFNASTCHIS